MNKENNPILSIITINYNNAVGLQRTVHSVLSQTYTDFEYIIVDGASTDGSKEILEQLQHSKDAGDIAFPLTIISESDSGIYNAMNKGIRHATGDYCLFLNSADYFTDSTILARTFAHITDADIIYGNRIDVDANGCSMAHDSMSHITLRYMHLGTLPHQASFIRRTLFDVVGMYREDLIYASDWEFFLKALFHYNATTLHLDISIVYFDITGISSQEANRAEMLAERERVFAETLPYLKEDVELLETSLCKLRQYDRKAQKVGKIILFLPRWLYHHLIRSLFRHSKV